MADTLVESLILDLLEWVAKRERTYEEVMDACARLAPNYPSGKRRMIAVSDMWRAWIGFNFSHSLGVLLVAVLALWAGFRTKMLPVGIIMPALTLIGCVYEVLALLYFRIPAIGVAVGTGCFAAARKTSL